MAHRLSRRSAAVATSDLTRYRDDPVAFVRQVLGQEPWSKQEAILRAYYEQPRVTVRSCNGAGKTVCAAWITLHGLLTRPGSIAITTAPTLHQVKNLLWRRLRTAFHAAKVALPGRCMTQMLEIDTDWYALGMSTDEEVNFQGPHSAAGVLFVGDEASGLAEWLFAAMQGSMTEEGAKMLLIGNPNHASGYFYESHNRWPEEQKFHISAFDVPSHVLTPGWKEQMLADYGEDSPVYQVRVLGEFPEQGADALISRQWITAAMERWEEGPTVGPVEMGADVARYGSDESGIYVRTGNRVLYGDFWRGNDTMATAGRIAHATRKHGVSVVKVDDIGVGAGVLDRLLEEKLPAVGVNVGEAAHDKENYADRRTEIFVGLAERFKQGDIAIPNDPLLLDQLLALRFSYTPRGQMRLMPKEQMRKERQGLVSWQSPDRADALAICFAPAGRGYRPAVATGPGRPMPRVVK